MNDNDVVLLPHLKNSIPDSISGYSTGFYSIALEGWRRGLSLKFINNRKQKANVLYELSDGSKKHKFIGSKGDFTSSKANKICSRKHETKKYLKKADVPTPEGKLFTEDISVKDLLAYANQLDYPVVLKPSDGARGDGVVAGIRNDSELKDAINLVRVKKKYKDIIIEKHFEGEDLRVFVVGNEVVAITKRIPANVIGDGKRTIRELIQNKNSKRRKSPILGSSLIKIDNELKQLIGSYDYNLDSVPLAEELVILKSNSNISTGGDPVDITNEISEELKNIAINAVKSIPELLHAGVDLMVNYEKKEAVIIEINTQPSIRTHIFPSTGVARDIPKKLIDLYFPETKAIENSSYLNFDFDPIWQTFRTGWAKEVKIPNIPNGKIKAAHIVINGVLDYSKESIAVSKLAKQMELNGSVSPLDSRSMIIIVAGIDNKIEQFKKELYVETGDNLCILDNSKVSAVKLGFIISNIKNKNSTITNNYVKYNPIRYKEISKIKKF